MTRTNRKRRKELYMIDYEKAHLVIFRKAGKVSHFRWYERDAGLVNKEVEKYNTMHRVYQSGLSAELVTDGLFREICAYREKTEAIDALKEEFKDMRESIREALYTLECVADDLRGVEIPFEEIFP
jgi:hypothetical protein